MITAKNEEEHSIELIPIGVERAVCYSVIDLGTHENPYYRKMVRKVLFQWELPDFRIDVERDGVLTNLPRAISKDFTLSLHEKGKLRPFLESWRGKKFTEEELSGFNVEKVAGVCGMLQVVHGISKKGREYAEVQGVTPLYKAITKFSPENPVQIFSLEDIREGEEIVIPDAIPQWIQERIKESEEWRVRNVDPKVSPREVFPEEIGDDDGDDTYAEIDDLPEDLPF